MGLSAWPLTQIGHKVYMKLPSQLESKRLIIRPFVVDDAEAVNVFTSDPEVTRYLPMMLRLWKKQLLD